MSVEVKLTGAEMLAGSLTGVMRQIKALLAGSADKHGADLGKGWQYHIEGALGEMAAARALGMYWDHAVGNYKAADLGEDVQVRTRSEHWHDLIVRPDDDSEHTYVLVTGRAPSYSVVGYILGSKAQQPEWWKSVGTRDKESWFVPQGDLHPISKEDTKCKESRKR